MTDTKEDICARKHRGNAQSVAANETAKPTKARQRERVLQACKMFGGVTCRELADLWRVGMNQISGRFSELKREGLIEKVGTRKGCGIYMAK